MFVTTLPGQPSLFGGGDPIPGPEFAGLHRIALDDEAWLDYAPTWLAGDETLYRVLADGVEWHQPEVTMYERRVITPRLVGTVEMVLHPAIATMSALLSDRYGVALDRVSAGWYRAGADSVAWHGDRIARERESAIVATVSLGAARRFLLRPREGGRSRSYLLGHGDLVVMGGACQRTWEHTVPKTARADSRIALMFRHAYD
jgi:alkylated DNA repair dioxygenase AlkB